MVSTCAADLTQPARPGVVESDPEAARQSMNAELNLPRVVIVDDHPAVLRQVMQVLGTDFEVVDALEDGDQLSAVVAQFAPDLIVLDITLPGLSGVDLAMQLRKSGCRAKIVFLTVHADSDYAREAFLVGASGYVLKPRLAADLPKALKAALADKRFISPAPELEELQRYFQE